MAERVNPCLRNDGTPKSAYPTRALAADWITDNVPGAEVQNVRPYPCDEHGWHVGKGSTARSHRRGAKGRW